MTKSACGVLVTSMLLIGVFATLHKTAARPAAAPPPSIDNDDIGGVVTSSKGPEAGVWVIAETKSLPTGYRKIVVTDEQGRYVVPDLPKGTYRLWVRGYGLVDSKPIESSPGKTVNLSAVTAPSARAAAQYYPASYWYSLLQVPPPSAFPMEKEGIQNQLEWIAYMKSAVQLYQVGDKATREVPEQLGKFKSTTDAWEAWIKTGESPINLFSGKLNHDLEVKMYADWNDRIAAGEIPPSPPRPQGVERNVVVTQWDVSNDKGFIHDVTVSDERHPTANANGLVYGVEQFSADKMDILDPIRGSWSDVAAPMIDHQMPPNYPPATKAEGDVPMTWGKEIVRPATMRLHNTMMDQKGRIWITAKFRQPKVQPEYCKAGSSIPSAKFYPLPRNGGDLSLQVELYDPETKKFTMVDTCYGTMHLEFAEDSDNTLWFSGGDQVIGWLDTKVFDETGDAAKAQGWCPYILDTNANGKVDAYVGPDDAVDPTKDKRIRGGSYGIGYNPVDGSIWEGTASVPGFILRIDPGKNPPYTCKTEIYNSPTGTSTPKGVYVDRSTGIVWVAFAGSGTLGSFDRRKCKVLSGPTATGDQCPEAWTLYPTPGPKFKGVTGAINTDWHYLNWVDQFNTLGLGNNVPLAPGTDSDSMIAFLPDTKKFVVMRVPYPLGFYSRGMDGRIDDLNAGWKGRGLWSNFASISPWTYEGGKGETPKVVKFQIRPSPLAN